MKVGYRLRIGLLIAVTMAGGTIIGILVNRGLSALPSAHDKPVAQLIRDLQKRDSGLDLIWQSIWPLLPAAISDAFPSLAPRNATAIRLDAAHALQSRGQDALPAIPTLLMALKDADPSVRLAALKALEELGPMAESALSELIAVLRSTNSPSIFGTLDSFRGAATLALAAIAPTDVRVIAFLRDSWRSEDFSNSPNNLGLHFQIVFSLERVALATNVAVPILIAALEESGIDFDPTPSQPLRATESFTQEQLLRWSQSRQAQEERISLSEHILAALGRIGPRTPDVIPTLRRALRSRTDPIRLSAVQALGLCRSNALPALPELLKILDETRSAPEPGAPQPPSEFRFSVLPAPSISGPNPSFGIATIPQTVVNAQAEISPTNRSPEPASQTDSNAQKSSVVLNPDGPVPNPERERIVPTVSISTGGIVRRYGMLPVPQSSPILSPDGAIPHTWLSAPLHLAVLQSLGEIGPAAQDALPALNSECAETNRSFRFDAALARWKIDRDANSLRSVLRDGLVHPQKPIRSKVLDFLGQIGVEALPELAAALTNDQASVRIKAMNSLATLGPAAESVSPILERSLTDAKYLVRTTAERTLRIIRADPNSTAKP